MPKIFISYRRDDNKYFVERFHDRLVTAFGRANVFQDVDDGIKAGMRWKDVLQAKLDESDVLLVVIGEKWEEIINARAHLPNDWVRFEVEQGLARTGAFVLIPILIEATNFPNHLPSSIEALSEFQLFRVRGNPNFHDDMDKLIELIQEHPNLKPAPVPKPAPRPKFNLPLVGAFVGLLALLIAGFIFLPPLLNTGLEGTNLVNNPTSTDELLSTEEFIESPSDTPTDEPTVTDTPTDEPTATDTPTDEPTITPSPEPTLSEYDEAIQRAVNFEGLVNDDWTPYIYSDFADAVPMVLVPAGCFEMGSTEEQILFAVSLGADRAWVEQAETPTDRICLEAFWIDQTEVTQADFERLGGEKANPNAFIGDELPVEQITWFEAYDYCQRQGKRLPTEAEWEYAARGLDSLIFPWGNIFIPDNAIYNSNSNAQTSNVGSRPNGISWVGTYDMAGNIWEFVNTSYGIDTNGDYSFADFGELRYDYPYRHDEREDYSESLSTVRIQRGGSWNSNSDFLRSSVRDGVIPDNWSLSFGFRCARDIEN